MTGEFFLPTLVISQIPQVIFETISEFSKVAWEFSEITREISENSWIIFGFSSTFFAPTTDISHFKPTTCAFLKEPASKFCSFLPRPHC